MVHEFVALGESSAPSPCVSSQPQVFPPDTAAAAAGTALFSMMVVEPSVSAFVYQQRPAASEKVRLGTEVTMSLTTDPAKLPAAQK